jgi:tRNA A37 N6-isopentenylltransferase MiaA
MADRQSLEQSNSEYKRQIEDELESLKSKAQTIGKQALIVGGGVLLVYALVTVLSSKTEKEKSQGQLVDNDSTEYVALPTKQKKVRVKETSNFLTEVVKEQALVFLLGIAAKKIGDFLNGLEPKKSQK